MAEQYNLNFMHPQYGTTLNVDIDAAFSVQEILEQLVLSGFVGKANAEYDLELMGQALEKQTVFAAIPNLYDGAVLRVVERVAPTAVATPVTQPINIHAQHPDHALPFKAAFDPLTKIEAVIERALQQGFIEGEVEDYLVVKGGRDLPIGESLQQLLLQEGDYVQFRRAEASKAVNLHSLQTQLESLQHQLQQVERQLPKDQALPHVEDLPYESLEKIVRRLRKRGKEPSLQALELSKSRVGFYVLLILLMLGGIGVLVVYNMGWL